MLLLFRGESSTSLGNRNLGLFIRNRKVYTALHSVNEPTRKHYNRTRVLDSWNAIKTQEIVISVKWTSPCWRRFLEQPTHFSGFLWQATRRNKKPYPKVRTLKTPSENLFRKRAWQKQNERKNNAASHKDITSDFVRVISRLISRRACAFHPSWSK